MTSTLGQLLDLASHLNSPVPMGREFERLAHLLVRTHPTAVPETLAASLRLATESKVLAKHACVASSVEIEPDRLEAALDGPPMRQTTVLRRVVRLQRFEQLAALPIALRERVASCAPVGELNRWGAEAPGSADFCAAFGLRHPLLYARLARDGGAGALRDEAAIARHLPERDWNGGRNASCSEIPWAYRSIVRAAADARHWELAEELARADGGDWATIELARAAIEDRDLLRAERYLASIGATSESARVRGVLLFEQRGRDYTSFLATLAPSGLSPSDAIVGVMNEARRRRDTGTLAAIVRALRTDQGFDRLDERREIWGGELVEALADAGQYEDAIAWSAKLHDALRHRYGVVRISHIAALRGHLAASRAMLAGRDDAAARAVFPLWAALEGGAFAPDPALPPRERAFWLLFQLEHELGASAVIERDIASSIAPELRPTKASPVREAVPSAAAVSMTGTKTSPDETFADRGIPFALYEAAASSCGRYVGAGRCAVTQRDEPHCFEVDHLIGAAETRSGSIVGYPAIRAGRAAFVIDTELGLVTPEWALGGEPGEEPGEEMAQIDRDALRELVRTPPYTTWQGEQWLFHCGRPMVFVGEHTPNELSGTKLDEADEAMLEDLEPEAEGLMTFRCGTCGTHRFHLDGT